MYRIHDIGARDRQLSFIASMGPHSTLMFGTPRVLDSLSRRSVWWLGDAETWNKRGVKQIGAQQGGYG